MGKVCEVCGTPDRLTRHHIQPKRAGGRGPGNYATLCDQHHALVERYYWWQLSFRHPKAASCYKQIVAAVLDGRIPTHRYTAANQRQLQAQALMETDVHWKKLFRQAKQWAASVEVVRPVQLTNALTERPWWRKKQ